MSTCIPTTLNLSALADAYERVPEPFTRYSEHGDVDAVEPPSLDADKDGGE